MRSKRPLTRRLDDLRRTAIRLGAEMVWVDSLNMDRTSYPATARAARKVQRLLVIVAGAIRDLDRTQATEKKARDFK